jgi:four helix bundle protein
MSEDSQERASAVEDLAVFQRAYGLSLEVHRVSLGFPKVEQFALGDQIRRASKSICANLAEGFGRQGRSPADFERFVVMAMGSADEMRVWTRYCRDLGHIDDARWDHWHQEYQAIARMLAGLLRSRTPPRARSDL